jgi:cell division protein FtsB
VRDIGERIRRYRLSRYGADAGRPRRLGWIWPVLGLWLIYAGLLGEHSWLRIWRMSRENEQTQKELAATRKEQSRLESQLHDPGAQRDLGEQTLRGRDGYARQGEIIYRIQERDSLR